jgi:hypothetical protein
MVRELQLWARPLAESHKVILASEDWGFNKSNLWSQVPLAYAYNPNYLG